MLKNAFFLLAFFLLSVNFSIAQQKTYINSEQTNIIVETQNVASLGLRYAKLNNLITKNEGKFEEKLQLSFIAPGNFEASVNNAKVMLTAYKADGSIAGRHIWCSAALTKSDKISENELLITLIVNPKLEGASKYSLSLFQPENQITSNNNGGTTCQQCVDFANDTCGRGKVASVNCDAEGGCSFTCK